MSKILFICFYFVTINSSKWITEARNFSKTESVKCERPYAVGLPACGSDGITYSNIWAMDCAQKNGKDVRFIHNYSCLPWEVIGVSTEIFFVSEF